MRRFIYLDTDTLNSYLAQIYDGLIETQSIENNKVKSKSKKNGVSLGMGANIALKLFGKGIDATGNGQYEYFRELANLKMCKQK